jgi:hypothetical protein
MGTAAPQKGAFCSGHLWLLYSSLDYLERGDVISCVIRATFLFMTRILSGAPFEVSPADRDVFAPEATADKGHPKSLTIIFAPNTFVVCINSFHMTPKPYISENN